MYSFLFKILKYFLIPFILGIILILILWVINSVYPFFDSFVTENSSNTLIVLDAILKFLKLNTQISAESLIARYSLNNALLNDILFSSVLLGSIFSLWRLIITTKRCLGYKNKVAEYYIPLEKSNKFYIERLLVINF